MSPPQRISQGPPFLSILILWVSWPEPKWFEMQRTQTRNTTMQTIMRKPQGLENEPEVHRRLEDASSPGKLVWQLPLDQPVPGDNRVTESCQALPVVLLNCFRDQEICRGSFGTFVVGLPRSFRVQRLPAGSQRAQPSAARAPSLARQGMANTLFDTCGRRRSSNKLKLLFEQQRRRLT